ncbi:MAG: aldehyde dehydrogenase family protein [Staphylococcus sp.]|nr:aldehyde dehydrogenase family protein [Staphylococcus sp.]
MGLTVQEVLQLNLIEKQFQESKQFFKTHQTKDIKFRKQQLKLLSKSIKDHETELLESLKIDLGKGSVEAYATEIGILLKSIKTARKELKNWAKTKQVDTPLFMFPSKSYIKPEPYGTILIIGPFNYPVQLLFEPLIGAIAAGNNAIIKPSELTPHVAQVVRKVIEDVFTSDFVAVVEGGVEETQTLINLPFDYIFFTGSENVGRIVYEAASKNLVPVTLELGGKSPVIVDETANIKVASDRISFGKFTNAGQTCVAPDYILVNRKVKNELIQSFKQSIEEFYGKNIQNSPDFGRIVNTKHFNRLSELLAIHRNEVIFGGHTDENEQYIEPTILDGITPQSKIMEEEIFGPVVSVITYNDLDEAIEIANDTKYGLAGYVIGKDKETLQKVARSIEAGRIQINESPNEPYLPFGGYKQSGIGREWGDYGIEEFLEVKSIAGYFK